MKIITFAFLFFSLYFSAQNHRFVYEYTFVKDSLEKDNTATENMTLDITKNGSKYYSYEVFASDSIMHAEIEKQIKMATSGSTNMTIKSSSSFTKGRIRTVIDKSYPNYKVFQTEKMGMNSYNVEDDRKIVWKILPETMKIGEFNAQKATTEMYGRKWIAWFSTELPFQDGPYKFHGLPGLIVKVEDATKSHVIELKGVKKLPNDFALPEKKDMFSGNTITLDYKKFKKAYIENRENPSKSMRQMSSPMSSSGAAGTYVSSAIVMKDTNGKVMDLNKMMNETDQKAKEANKKNNNLLELDLLK